MEENRYRLEISFALAATNNKRKLLDRVKRLFTNTPETNLGTFQKFKLVGLCLLLFPIMIGSFPQLTDKPNFKNQGFNNITRLNLIRFENFTNDGYSKNIIKDIPIKINLTKSQSKTKIQLKKHLKSG